MTRVYIEKRYSHPGYDNYSIRFFEKEIKGELSFAELGDYVGACYLKKQGKNAYISMLVMRDQHNYNEYINDVLIALYHLGCTTLEYERRANGKSKPRTFNINNLIERYKKKKT